jgi:hypothetical protein
VNAGRYDEHMVAVTSSGRRLAVNSDASAIDRKYFAVFGISLVSLNILTFLYHLSALSIFNIVSNAISIALIAYSVRTIFRAPRADTASRVFLTVAAVMTVLSLICNLKVASIADGSKYLSIYVFYAAGRACGGQIRPIELRCVYVLGALPLIFLVTSSSKVFAGESFFSEVFAYLPNANTAVLYFSALLFAVAQLYGDRIILFQFINALLMNRIGAVLSTVVAVCLWVAFPLRRESIIGLFVVGGVGFIGFLLGAFDRAIGAIDNLWLVFSIEPSQVSSMSFAELVQLTGSTDLSAFFRLIHWSNVLDLYLSGGIGTLLVGYGAGQTATLTYATLVPHNDYLRILAEYGPFNLTIFVSFLLYIRSGLTTGATKVLFVVLCIYFFSENLLDNFTSMAIYFAYAGRFTAASRRPVLRAVPKYELIVRGLADGRAG